MTFASCSCALGQEAWRTPPDRDVGACYRLVPVTQNHTITHPFNAIFMSLVSVNV